MIRIPSPMFRPARCRRAASPPGRSRATTHWLTALLLLPILVPASALAGELIALDASQQAAFGIQTVEPIPAETTLSRRYPAEVAVPNRQLRVVAAPQSGVLESLKVAEGERVGTGQVLAELRSPELVDTQSQYLEALIRLELVDSELARDRKLHREGVIAERRLLETQSRQRELATLLDQHCQLLELAGLAPEDIATLTRTRRLTSTLPVHAPIAGVVLEQMVTTGQSVASAAPLYRIAEPDPLWLEIHVPVDQLEGIAAGAKVFLTRQGTAGEVVTIGRMVHGQDQGVLVRAEISEGVDQLRPGQFVEVQLLATLRTGATPGQLTTATSGAPVASWRLPAGALVRQADVVHLFVARPGGFEALPVTLVGEEEQSAVVRGELTAADRIAVSGVAALKAAWLGGE
ncbi:efflux RND transporter periplasmic adaptor subunit [Thiocystis minor]|uniref:efflux RND transporter periplasmic adaptor subunit n=1 Tax=Thiocystis minor TaxID=61597 RepID=UPI001F5C1963|nr:efflux RND transporter periplasmic adaptor subunit [Thiocystis minor]